MNLKIFGIPYKSLRERYLREPDLILSRAIRAGHATEETHKHAHEILQFQTTADLRKIKKLCKHL